MEYLELVISARQGIPCLWECGGRTGKSGSVQVLVRADGTPPHATYVKSRAYCGNHALIPVIKGMLVIRASSVDGEATIYVSRIDTIERETARCGVVDILQFKGFYTDLEGVLTQAGFQHLVKACKVAFRKTNCVDCEKPHFCQVRGPDGVWEDVVRVNDNKAPVLFNELEV